MSIFWGEEGSFYSSFFNESLLTSSGIKEVTQWSHATYLGSKKGEGYSLISSFEKWRPLCIHFSLGMNKKEGLHEFMRAKATHTTFVCSTSARSKMMVDVEENLLKQRRRSSKCHKCTRLTSRTR